MAQMSPDRKETLKFRATVVCLVIVGALVLYASVFRGHRPRDDAPPPTIPSGDAPPPSRL